MPSYCPVTWGGFLAIESILELKFLPLTSTFYAIYDHIIWILHWCLIWIPSTPTWHWHSFQSISPIDLQIWKYNIDLVFCTAHLPFLEVKLGLGVGVDRVLWHPLVVCFGSGLWVIKLKFKIWIWLCISTCFALYLLLIWIGMWKPVGQL